MAAEPDGRRAPSLPMAEGARLLGAYAWAEQRLFEVLGGFVASEPVAAAARFFDTRAQHHAWHASLLAEQVPQVPGIERGSPGAPPGAGASQAFEALAVSADAASRLAVLARVVLPRLVAGYRTHLGHTAPAADAPIVRALRLVVRDDVEAMLEAEALFERVVAAHPAGMGPALERLGTVEAGLAGVGPGIVPWPASVHLEA